MQEIVGWVGGVREDDLSLPARHFQELGACVLVEVGVVPGSRIWRPEKVVGEGGMGARREGMPWASLLIPHCLWGQGVEWVVTEGGMVAMTALFPWR
jgi:hypothetical protein